MILRESVIATAKAMRRRLKTFPEDTITRSELADLLCEEGFENASMMHRKMIQDTFVVPVGKMTWERMRHESEAISGVKYGTTKRYICGSRIFRRGSFFFRRIQSLFDPASPSSVNIVCE